MALIWPPNMVAMNRRRDRIEAKLSGFSRVRHWRQRVCANGVWRQRRDSRYRRRWVRRHDGQIASHTGGKRKGAEPQGG